MILATAGFVLGGPLACSDENATGPQFGDLDFTPSFVNLGADVAVELTLTNSGEVELGPILVGKDALFPVTDPTDLRCDDPNGGIEVVAVPSSIASLAPGEDVSVQVAIDTENVDVAKCPPAQYDADMFAAVGGDVLGGATIRFDWQP